MDQIMCKPCIASRRMERGTDAVTVLRGFVARTEACAVCGARAPLLVVEGGRVAWPPVSAVVAGYEAALERARAVPAEIGEGWLSRPARDLVRVAAFAGFDMAELVRRVALSSDPRRVANAATVARVMAEMDAEWVAANRGI